MSEEDGVVAGEETDSPWDVWLTESEECSDQPSTSALINDGPVERVVASMPHQKALCYGYTPAMEEHLLVRCRFCSLLVKEIGYGHHVGSRHRERAGSPDSISGDESQLFLLSPPPPVSPKRTYFVEQRDDLVLKLSQTTSAADNRSTSSRKRRINQTVSKASSSSRNTTIKKTPSNIAQTTVMKRHGLSKSNVAEASPIDATLENTALDKVQLMKPPTRKKDQSSNAKNTILEDIKQSPAIEMERSKLDQDEEKKPPESMQLERKPTPPNSHPRPQSLDSAFLMRAHPAITPKRSATEPQKTTPGITVRVFDRRLENMRIQLGRAIVPRFAEFYPPAPPPPQRFPRAPRLRRLLTSTAISPPLPQQSMTTTPYLRASLEAVTMNRSVQPIMRNLEPDIITLSESPPPPVLTAAVNIPQPMMTALDEVIEVGHSVPPSLAPNIRPVMQVPTPLLPRPMPSHRQSMPQTSTTYYWSDPSGNFTPMNHHPNHNPGEMPMMVVRGNHHQSNRRVPMMLPSSSSSNNQIVHHHHGHHQPMLYPRRSPQHSPLPPPQLAMYAQHHHPQQMPGSTAQWRRLRPNDGLMMTGGPSNPSIKLVPVSTTATGVMTMPQNAAGQFVVPIRQSGINVTGVGMNSSRDITGVQVVQLPQRNNGNIPLARRLVNMEEDGVPPSLIYRVQPVD